MANRDKRFSDEMKPNPLRDYGNLVTYVLWLEAMDRISSRDASAILKTDPLAYSEYLGGELSHLLDLSTYPPPPDRLVQATELMKRELRTLYPSLADDIKKLSGGRGY